MRNATPIKQMQVMSTKNHNNPSVKLLDIQKVGSPKKDSEHVKRKLAFANSNDSGKKKWGIERYKKRKQTQHKQNMSKQNAYKAQWQDILIDFLEKHSRVMPNKKDTVLIQGKPVAKRHLLCSKLELYRKF